MRCHRVDKRQADRTQIYNTYTLQSWLLSLVVLLVQVMVPGAADARGVTRPFTKAVTQKKSEKKRDWNSIITRSKDREVLTKVGRMGGPVQTRRK